MDVISRLEKEKLVPVIKLDTPEQALPLVDALAKGGITVAEVTFRTDAAAASIKLIKENRPDILVGAGTVLTLEQLDAAIDAGAEFIVSPGFNPAIVQACIDRNIPITPGVTNPSQVEQAMHMGLKVLKFFPAELSGGIPMLKAFGSVYNARFMPTGGLNVDNFTDYLALPNVVACGGSWMVKGEYIKEGQYDTVTELSAAAKGRIK
ncbi:MAG: bifunctional 4-hydroxy-2-oxoglutarate aldolase/2-dehydro-3-deoxy-phosphogluconate aldolase [Spirochaetales bacterium]|nr:bifunctional 4-hydroxy-2-oxoglutarate aldolase/2-dehydro-3-deoxy-phosphogluconate aldolase [Spirochaetales bacterium]